MTANTLPPNLVDQHVYGSVTSYSFTNGLNTISSSDPNSRMGLFVVSTDMHGDVIATQLFLTRWYSPGRPHAFGDPASGIIIWVGSDVVYNNATCSSIDAYAGVTDVCVSIGGGPAQGTSSASTNVPGTWSSVTSGPTTAAIPTLSWWNLAILAGLVSALAWIPLRWAKAP